MLLCSTDYSFFSKTQLSEMPRCRYHMFRFLNGPTTASTLAVFSRKIFIKGDKLLKEPLGGQNRADFPGLVLQSGVRSWGCQGAAAPAPWEAT